MKFTKDVMVTVNQRDQIMYDKNQNGTTNAQLTVDDVRNSDFGFDELTEDEFENATDAVQVRNLIEINYVRAFKRDDVEKKIEIKAGNKKSNARDTRRRIALYKIPQGWFYFVADEVYTFTQYSVDKPDYGPFSEDALRFVEFAVDEKDMDVDEAFEFTEVDEEFENLREEIEADIFEVVDA